MGIEDKLSLLRERVRANPRLLMIVGAPAVIAIVVAAWLWGRAPDYGVLYSNLSGRDGGAIIASLQQMNVPYRVSEGGTAVLIPADKVPEVRLRLASQGLPNGGGAGFELLDNQKFGTSQFAEQINYQRALEGQLARSIESISAVESARVHLALPKPSVFMRSQQKPTASVVLKLFPGRAVDEGQVNAIAHLVSSSVPELTAGNVTIVDQAGNLLSMQNSGARGLDAGQLKYTREIEHGYIRRIEEILRPIVGEGNVRAQVTADIDFSVTEDTNEKYRPNQEPGTAAVRSQQSSESTQHGATPPGGIPGALTNQPPAPPAAPIVKPDSTGTTTAARAGQSSARRDVTTNYEVDRSIRHVQSAMGGLRRLSAAVVVNHVRVRTPDGKSVVQALSAAEQEQILNLVKQAMGYNATRGDAVNVVHSRFASETQETDDSLFLWRKPDIVELIRNWGLYLFAGLLALLIVSLAVFLALRRRDRKKAAAEAAAPEAAGKHESTPEQQAQQTEAQRRAERYEDNLKYAQETAEKNPELAAAVIKYWMDSDD